MCAELTLAPSMMALSCSKTLCWPFLYPDSPNWWTSNRACGRRIYNMFIRHWKNKQEKNLNHTLTVTKSNLTFSIASLLSRSVFSFSLTSGTWQINKNTNEWKTTYIYIYALGSPKGLKVHQDIYFISVHVPWDSDLLLFFSLTFCTGSTVFDNLYVFLGSIKVTTSTLDCWVPDVVFSHTVKFETSVWCRSKQVSRPVSVFFFISFSWWSSVAALFFLFWDFFDFLFPAPSPEHDKNWHKYLVFYIFDHLLFIHFCYFISEMDSFIFLKNGIPVTRKVYYSIIFYSKLM